MAEAEAAGDGAAECTACRWVVARRVLSSMASKHRLSPAMNGSNAEPAAAAAAAAGAGAGAVAGGWERCALLRAADGSGCGCGCGGGGGGKG